MLFDACAREAKHLRDLEDFKEWTRTHVRRCLPHEALSCSYGRLYGVGVSLDYVVTVDYPVEHLAAIRNPSGHMDTPLARRWYERQEPVFFDERYPPADTPEEWLGHFRMHGLRNAAADGMLDRANCLATYFSFHRMPVLDETQLRGTFKTLVPLMHQTFVRVIRHLEESQRMKTEQADLTPREREIANWISQGKSNSDIAAILEVSENTVKNHVKKILDKTGCGNRTGLAASLVAWEQIRFGGGTKVL